MTRNYWLRSGALTLMEKATGLFFGLGTSMILWRALSKEDMAAWGLFLLVTYTLEMGRSGLIQNGLMRYLALHRKDHDTYMAICRAALFLNFCFSLVSNVVLYFSMNWLIETYQAPQLATVLPVYFATNFVMILMYQFNFIQQANFEFKGIFWSSFLFRGGLFAWVLTCRYFDLPFDLTYLALCMLVSAAFGALASWHFAKPYLFQWTARLSKVSVTKWIKELASYGKYVLGTNLSTMFFKSIDKLTLGYLIGPLAFAEYDVASKITQMVEAPSFSMAAIVFPQSAEKIALGEKSGIKKLYERSVGAVLAMILPFIVVVLIFAEEIIRAIAGWQYPESVELLRLTAFFGLFMPFAVQFGTILDSSGRPRTNFIYTTATAMLNLVLSYVMVSKIGIMGAALATLSSYSISFIFAQMLLHKDFGVNPLAAFRYIPLFYVMIWEAVFEKLGRMRAGTKDSANTPPLPPEPY